VSPLVPELDRVMSVCRTSFTTLSLLKADKHIFQLYNMMPVVAADRSRKLYKTYTDLLQRSRAEL
jgi:hypothetical protein